MKKSDDKKETKRRHLHIASRNDNPKPDGVRVEFIGELAPHSKKKIPMITIRLGEKQKKEE